jgi:serine/threonine-protein phosphatase 2A regulatory subunit A
MAAELGQFVPALVGGFSRAGIVLNLLVRLATAEETVVRGKACEVFNEVLNACAVEDAVSFELREMVQRLAEGDWFTARVSGASIVASAYGKISDEGDKENVRDIFARLCEDDTPMVRRAAAESLGAMAMQVDAAYLTETLMGQWTKVAEKDDQESCRLLAMGCTTDIIRCSADPSIPLEVAKRGCSDRSWRVRQSLASQLGAIGEILGAEAADQDLLPSLVELLQDPEMEVRQAATKQLALFADIISAEKFGQNVGPMINALVNDGEPKVRLVWADLLPKLAGIIAGVPAVGGGNYGMVVLNEITTLMGDAEWNVRLEMLKQVVPETLNALGFEQAR